MAGLSSKFSVNGSQVARAPTPALLVVTVLSVGCATAPAQRPQNIVSMECLRPTFSPMPETEETQEHGGVQISVAPVTYDCVRDSEVTKVSATPSFKERMQAMITVGGEGTPTHFVETTRRPVLRADPERLRFYIRINNKLPRVFRGSGIVVQFVVMGKERAVEQALYADLINAIVPPRSELQVSIQGPYVDTLEERGTIALDLYDVVTNTDEAGNITEKHYFNWYYQYVAQLEQETGVAEVTRGWERR